MTHQRNVQQLVKHKQQRRRNRVYELLCCYFGTSTTPSGSLQGRTFLADAFVQTIIAFCSTKASTGSGGGDTAVVKCHHCCDCGRSNPEWANITYGTLVCIDCAYHHRTMDDRSVVKSLTLDSWDPRDVAALLMGGNLNFQRGFLRWHGHNRLVWPSDGEKSLQLKYGGKFAGHYRTLLKEASKVVCSQEKMKRYSAERGFKQKRSNRGLGQKQTHPTVIQNVVP